MAKLIVLSFENISNGASYDFLAAGCRVQKFQPTYAGRVVDRPRMQMHGSNPTVPYIDKLPIHEEGLLLGTDVESLMLERDSFLRAMLGNLTRRKTAAKSGTLTVQYASWGEAGTVAVAVDAAEAPLDKADGQRTCNFMVSWTAFAPYALGSFSGDPLYL